MNINIINTSGSLTPLKYLDNLLIPNEIYNETINYDTEYLTKYFLDNPKLMLSFVGFNSKLKQANQLSSNRKFGGWYKMPWITKYAADNNIKKTILLFPQQVSQYKYTVRYWFPNQPNLKLEQSYMRYLSSIALKIILDLKILNSDVQNNLTFNICCKNNIYLNYFKNSRELIIFVQKFINIIFE